MTTRGEQLAEYFDPTNYNSLRPPSGVVSFHPDHESMWEAVSHHRAGLATTAPQHEAIRRAEELIYPDGWRTTEVRVLQADEDPEIAVVEWRAQATTWKGREAHNGGLSLYEFEDGAVRRIRNFTNTAYLQKIEEGWDELLPTDVLMDIPAWHTLHLPNDMWRPYHPYRGARTDADPPLEVKGTPTVAEKFALSWDPPVFSITASEADLAKRNWTWEAAPEFYMEFQGTRWHLAGRNIMAERVAPPEGVSGSSQTLYGSLGMSHMATWSANDGEWAIGEWMSTAIAYTGKPFRNHGLTIVQHNAKGQRIAHREYLNVAFLEAIEGDWKHLLPEGYFNTLTCSKTYDLPTEEWRPIPIKD